ncbi:hypothetical protein DBR42_23260 [Pelomonas sp. HMWF004]|nr:hypothetical protein DBR42_23260 [Pelomonas sp. HMWF004]
MPCIVGHVAAKVDACRLSSLPAFVAPEPVPGPTAIKQELAAAGQQRPHSLGGASIQVIACSASSTPQHRGSSVDVDGFKRRLCS